MGVTNVIKQIFDGQRAVIKAVVYFYSCSYSHRDNSVYSNMG